MSVRIHQIAKQIGMENKDLLKLLQERGFAVKSVSSTIDNISADSLIEEYATPESEVPAATEMEETSASEPAVSEEESTGREPAFKRPTGPIVRSPEQVEREKAEAKEAAKPPPVEKPAVPVQAKPTAKSAPKPPQMPAFTPRAQPKAPRAPAPPPAQRSAPKPPPVRSASDVAPPPPGPQPAARPAAPPPPARPTAPPPPVAPHRPPTAPRPPAPPPGKAGPRPPTPTPDTGGATESVEPKTGEGAPETPPPARKKIQAKTPIIVRDFATLLNLKPFKLISDLMERGIFASMNQTIEEDLAAKLAETHGYELLIRHRGGAGEPGEPGKKAEEEVDESALLKPRPPVVCILGHVDHGKTTLLDTIRKSKVTEDEFGGITQHIGAYQIDFEGEPISFLDTPGHAAFAGMRERGASTTDIAILVVAADDGFKPQTDEALKFAKKAQVSLIVAINKIDTKGANIDRVKQQMMERGIPPEDLGGEVITVPVSALKGEGIDHLLDMIRLQTEIMELKAVPTGKSSGVIIESQIEQGRGPTATVLVKRGCLKVGDALVCGTASCKVKAMHDDLGKPVKQAGPSTPVKVLGWSDVPDSGAVYETARHERDAKRIAEEVLEERKKKEEEERLAARSKGSSLDDLFSAIESTRKVSFNVILKADVHGSLEAISGMLKEIPSDQIELKIVGKGVGMVTKKDVELASAANATIVGFNVRLENGVQGHAKHLEVSILQDSIIYQLVDLVRESMAELLEPELREKKLGVAEVRVVFPLGKSFVAGCMVTEGKIQRNATTRLLRKGELVHEGRVGTLKRFKDDVNEVRAGFECGVAIAGFNDYREGDHIECYEVEKIRPSL